MAQFLTEDDFTHPADYEAYLWSLFAKRLKPQINQDHAAQVIRGFLNYAESMQGNLEAQDFLSLAEEILEGPHGKEEQIH